MRILFISNFYPPYELGGWEQNCHEVVEHLQARGHQCHVLTSRHGVDGRSATEPGITRALYLQADIYHYRPLDFFLRRPGQERANLKALRTTVEAFRPDVVFIWGMWNLSLQVAYWAEQGLPGRVAYAVAGYWFIEPDPHEAYWQSMDGRTVAQVLLRPARWWALRRLAQDRAAFPLQLQHVACVSHYVRHKLSQAGVLPHGARVIYNGIDPAPFLAAAERRQPSENLRLVYTGGLLPHKGVHTAIEALGKLKRAGQINGLTLALVGPGHPDYQAHLQARIEALGLDGHVAFRGRVPRSEIPAVLADHDVFLFTSIYEEPIARTVQEAMAAGLAVVATPVGGQAEMLEDGVNALVFPPDDPERLAQCVLRLRQDRELRQQLAAAGQRTVLERFTLRRMVDEFEAWLAEIVG
ncbi:MAG: glycosyltransferase family 4 protein [Anaerolineae bacterium]|nr:glycosyltransferase family 4 protein [Anaerolineae bacterium]